MVEILGMVAAVLLVLCLLLIADVLGYQARLKEANDERAEIEKQAKRIGDNLLEANKRHIEDVEEIARLTGELAVVRLSLKNAQNQHGELVEFHVGIKEERDEYKEMLKSIAHIFAYERDLIDGVIKEHEDFEAQGG